MITVRKFKLAIVNEDENIVNEQYKYIRESQYAQYQGLNRCMSYLISGFFNCKMDWKSEEFKEIKKSIKSKMPIYEGINFGTGLDTRSLIRNKILSDFGMAIKKGFARGESNMPSYKRTTPLMTHGRHLNFYGDIEKREVYIKWIHHISFKVLMGHKPNKNLDNFLGNVLNGTYKVCQSSLEFDKKKLILNLTCDMPENKDKPNFINGREITLDFADESIFKLTSKHTKSCKNLGSKEYVINTRKQFSNRYRDLQRNLITACGGHGKKRKLKALEGLKSKESNFSKTYNHALSKAVIDFAINNKAQIINIPKIDYEKEDEDIKLLNYSTFTTFLKYKADRVGIEVRYRD